MNLFKTKQTVEITLENIINGMIKPSDIKTCEDVDRFSKAIKPVEDEWLSGFEHIGGYRMDNHPYTSILTSGKINMCFDVAEDFNWRVIRLNLQCGKYRK